MERDFTRGVSAVILAAGANQRLQSIVPPYMKPLLLVNGRPLIQHAVDHAVKDWKVSQTIIVCGPENARLLTEVLVQRDSYDWIVQPRPSGFADAVHRAIYLAHYDRILLLCADNTFTLGDVDELPSLVDTSPYIGVRRDVKDPQRFTRLADDGHGNVVYDPNGTACWIGPLYVYTARLVAAFGQRLESGNDIVNELGYFKPLEMRCEDLGIPEALS